jgi:hypothetical protein
MKLKVQAQHLQPGDIVGSGDKVMTVVRNSTKFPSNKVEVWFEYKAPRQWGKYTEINIERPNG